MDIEHWLPTDILLSLTFFLAFALEIVRYFRLRMYHLNLTWTGGWRYAYYLPRLALTAGLGPGLATAFTWGLTRLWRYLLSLLTPYSLYGSGLLWLFLTGGVAGLLFVALYKAKATIGEVIKPLLLWTALDALFFAFEPLRWVFGGTLILLVTSAMGQKVRFTGWQDIVEWLHASSEETSPQETATQRLAKRLYQPRRIRIVALTETEGYLFRSGESEVEIEEEPVDPAEKVSRFILDASRLATLAEAVQRAEERADLLQEIPSLIAENVERIVEYKREVERGEGDSGEKKRRVKEFICREVFEATGFGRRMRSLLYWHYGLPEEKVCVAINPVPRVRLVPLLSWAEYLGLFLGKASAAEPSREERRRR